MASPVTHLFAAWTLTPAMLGEGAKRRVLVAAGLCSLLPDLDVLGFALGVPYGHFAGHRGVSHSLAFAAAVALVAAAVLTRGELRRRGPLLFACLFAVTASHGVFDAMTDGGLGVAFFAPFDNGRYFLPLRPVAVSPLGVSAFFGYRAVRILASEIVWIWLPWAAVCAVLFRARGRRS